MKTSDGNTGGRVNFSKGTNVRVLDLDGTVGSEIYTVEKARSDGMGQLSLRSSNGREVMVHHRRVLPVAVAGNGVVVESGGRYSGICPKCGQVQLVTVGDDAAACTKCGPFQLYWSGVNTPMSETTTAEATAKTPKSGKAAAAAPKAAKAAKAAKAPKPPKEVKTPTAIDLAGLAKTANCELWTKGNVAFDHARITLQAHVLIFTGDSPRKLCFNTYNGNLGKKASALPVAEFLNNKPASVSKKDAPWFAVDDLEKQRAKLLKDGYELAK